MNYLVLVEPIFRGSRLQILFYVLDALSNQYDKIYILTRSDYFTEHYVEFSNKFKVHYEIISVNDLKIEGVWIKKLSIKEMFRVLKSFKKLLGKLKEDSKSRIDVIFMALDDYYIPFIMLQRLFLINDKTIRYYGIKYRVLYNCSDIFSCVKQILVFVSLKYLMFSKIKIIIFDERINDYPSIIKSGFSIIPDPWEGNYSTSLRDQARKKYNIESDKFVISLIGKQNKRKGFSFILSHIEEILTIYGNIIILISGKVENPREEMLLQEIANKYGKRIIYINHYLSEKEIVYSYAASDVILLPYSKDFNSSSGVLVRACATEVPVITSKHGLVGYRVKNNKIGLTFEFGNFSELRICIEKMINDNELYNFFKMGCRLFANKNSIASFKKQLIKIFT